MKTAIALALLALLSIEAWAQAQTFYDAAGRVTARSSTDSSGAITYYDAAGRVIGHATTDTGGTTVFYDAAGHRVGSVARGPSGRP